MSASKLYPSLVKSRCKKSDPITEKEMRSLLEDAIDMTLDKEVKDQPTAMMAYRENPRSKKKDVNAN